MGRTTLVSSSGTIDSTVKVNVPGTEGELCGRSAKFKDSNADLKGAAIFLGIMLVTGVILWTVGASHINSSMVLAGKIITGMSVGTIGILGVGVLLLGGIFYAVADPG